MKTYFSDLIPKIVRYTQKLEDCTLLKNHHWVLINDVSSIKIVYIFKDNGLLLISKNGVVQKEKWEYLSSNSLLLEVENTTFLVHQAFGDNEALALNIDGSNQYALFVNETKHGSFINSYEQMTNYLENKYLKTLYLSKESKYYYTHQYKEYGPYSPNILIGRVSKGEISKMCFIREETQKSYEEGLRIDDLIKIQNL